MEPDASWLEIYHNGWSTPEEYDWVTVWETIDGSFWVRETSHNVYTGTHESLTSVSEDRAVEIIIAAEERFAEG